MHPFQVYARVRPLNQKQQDYSCGKKAVTILDNQNLAVGDQDSRETYFQLDSIFGQDAQNEQIFNSAVRPLTDNFLRGINSTVLAYGITGAGKSFTMFGKNNDSCRKPGLIELAIEYVCDNLSNEEDVQLTLSYMEIYNEQVFDLLRHKSQSLQILDDPIVGVVVNDLEQVPIFDTETALKYIADGNYRRVVAETRANQFSSRSHAIVQINLEKKVGDSIMAAKLSLVDLAGSEKQSVYAQNKGIRNFQGSNINKSLLTLGNCINILSSKKGYVPYRDSKLTRLLKDSLGGNTRTSMIACVSPSQLALEETINTMKYACRARKIQKIVHQNIREPRTTQQFKRQILKLRRQLDSSKTEGYKAINLTKQQMQQMLHKLIKNVEDVTKIRLNYSTELSQKMKEIDLIDEQRAIVNNILSKFNDQPQIQQRFSVIKNGTDKLIPGLRNKEGSLIHKQNQNLCRISQQQFDNSPLVIEKRKKDHLFLAKNKNFQITKLENRRLRCRQIRKNLTQLVISYYQRYENEQQRLQQIQKSQNFIQHQNLFSVEQCRVLLKLNNGEQLNHEDLILFQLQQSQQITQQNKIQQISPQKNNNRFMSSLQQIRKMMRKISSRSQNMNMLDDQYEQNCNINILEMDPIGDGLFNYY